MNRGRIIVLFMAVGCAALAMFLVKNMVKAPRTKVVKQEVSETHVLVADTNIQLGETVKRKALRWQAWPDSAASGYITRNRQPRALEKYAGSIARVTIGAGDPIRPSKLVKPDQGGVMAAILPSGQRAISIEISNEQGVSGLILPNDRVDIVLSIRGNRGGDDHKPSGETLLRNVRVLAIGETFETKNGQKSIKGKTATLALSPVQVEIITQARSRGELWLALRSLADANEKDNGKRKSATTSVKLLKYGVASQAFGLE